MKTLQKKYRIKWIIEGYSISECNKIFNSKNGRELKQSMVNYSIGYYLNGKFRTLSWIKKNCKKVERIKLPF